MNWRKASFCASGECVEVGAEFVKSSHSSSGNCVEAAFTKASYSGAQNCVEAAGPFTKATASNPYGSCVEQVGCSCGVDVLVRDSKNPDGPVLEFSRQVWMEFLAEIKAGGLTG